MEHTNENEGLNAPEEGYTPRPAWQVWAARIGLALFILFVIYQIVALAGSGR